MFPTIITVLFLLALIVGALVYIKSRKEDISAADSVAREIMAIEFEYLRAQGEKPVVAMFFATWCTACVAQVPSFRRVANELSDLAHFVFIDIDKNESFKNRMEIRKIPVLMVFTEQESYAAKHIGVLDDAALTEFVKNAVEGS